MKKIILLMTAALLCQSILFAQNGEISGAEYCSKQKISAEKYFIHSSINAADIPHGFDVLNYKLNIDLYKNFNGNSQLGAVYPHDFTAVEELTILVDSSLNQINLNADNKSLKINTISEPAINFTHLNNILTIKLDKNYEAGDTVKVIISYNHNDIEDNAFYSDGGFVFTDCEPEGARKWFPCYDTPSDKATLNLTAAVPSNVKLGSNGFLADSVLSNDTLYYNWISRNPIATYLMVVTARENYNLDIVYWKKNKKDSIPFRFYFNPNEDISVIHSVEEKVLEMTDFYSSIFALHPFDKNGFASLNDQFYWGGMENQTLTSICPNCWFENLISHEFAHQWFGDMITCATWADIFLNEGFATYCEALWYEHISGYNSYKNDIKNDADYYLQYNPHRPISDPDWAVNTPSLNVLFNTAMTYDKGACVLHQLRYVLGDSLFFAGLHNYANDPKLKFHSASIRDFIRVINTTAGEDLSWFFDEWIFKPNHPDYTNGYWISSSADKYQVGFLAKQVQKNPSFFKMPIEIKVTFESGADTVVRVMNDMNDQIFTFDFTDKPASVRFDPNDNIVLKTASLEKISPVSLVEKIDKNRPEKFKLSQNFPNPFNPETVIQFDIPISSKVRISVYNLLGQLVKILAEGEFSEGSYQTVFNAQNFSSGIYFYELKGENFTIRKKMILEK